jgi:hypothetical protein
MDPAQPDPRRVGVIDILLGVALVAALGVASLDIAMPFLPVFPWAFLLATLLATSLWRAHARPKTRHALSTANSASRNGVGEFALLPAPTAIFLDWLNAGQPHPDDGA